MTGTCSTTPPQEGSKRLGGYERYFDLLDREQESRHDPVPRHGCALSAYERFLEVDDRLFGF